MLGILAVALAIAPEIARAHAIVVSALPAMNATVAPGHVEIRLDFNGRIDQYRSRLRLRRPDGTPAEVAFVPNAAPNVLAGRAEATMPGDWKLDWQVLSLDGHITRGEVIFSVHEIRSPP